MAIFAVTMQMILNNCYGVGTEKMIRFEALNEGGDPYTYTVGGRIQNKA